jgi:folate-dependent tRNA-U54 methylase TrmFO/GidA
LFLIARSRKEKEDDAYHRRMMEKEQKNGLKNAAVVAVRTVFNDEEQRRYVDICMIFSYCIPAIA